MKTETNYFSFKSLNSYIVTDTSIRGTQRYNGEKFRGPLSIWHLNSEFNLQLNTEHLDVEVDGLMHIYKELRMKKAMYPHSVEHYLI